MNPVLLKPLSGTGAQIVLHGKVFGNMDAMGYHAYKPKLKEAVQQSYYRLASEYDVIVMEGAGSCLEMNLKENDIVNFPMALAADARCVLVADIDRGGVFAQLIGSHVLMTEQERQATVGFIINKFRGDPALFQSGISYIEDATGKPVFGLVPFFTNIAVDSEDSVAIQKDKRSLKKVGVDSVNIAVLRLPGISNFTDLEILDREPDMVVNFLSYPEDLNDEYDLIVLPGTKNTMGDARWVRETGWETKITDAIARGKRCMGICGGFQLLGRLIEDPCGVEASFASVSGLGLLPLHTTLSEEKIVRKVEGFEISGGKKICGYEIHMGLSRKCCETALPFLRIGEPGKNEFWEDGLVAGGGKIVGTYVHGIFDMPEFRNHYFNVIRREKGILERRSTVGSHERDGEYDKLADHFERFCDVERILKYL
jgi:adenosylcobyric acid synthase